MFGNGIPCNCDCNNDYTNLFLDLSGQPFILDDYLDRKNIQSIDRSAIYSQIDIDNHESMRALVDISIDDVGKNTDGTPSIVGNNTKQKQLIDDIIRNYSKLDHQLPMLKKDIGICINYQLENNRTGYVIRAAQEKLIINDRSFYLDINSKDINDNAIIANFNTTQVSTLTEFTHGTDPMILRITSIQLYYHMVPAVPINPYPEMLVGKHPIVPHGMYGDMHSYLRDNQYHQFIGDQYGCNDPVMPPQWSMFNRMYHFDDMGRTIILHKDEIYNPRNKVVEIPCGSITVNRSFYINPGHRIIWRFNIWKNDIIAVSDTSAIGAALKAPCYIPCPPTYPQPPVCPHPPMNHPNCNPIMNMYNASVAADYEQNAVINKLADMVSDLKTTVDKLANPDTNPDTNPDENPDGETTDESIPATPLTPAQPIIPHLPEGPSCGCKPCPPPPPPFCPDPVHGALIHKMKELEKQMDQMGDDMVDEGELTPIASENISDIVQDAINSVPDQST